MTGAALGHLRRCACDKDLATTTSSFGTQVDDVICRLDDVEMVLDDDDCVPCIYETMQAIQQA